MNMRHNVSVRVVWRKTRNAFILRWTDPVTLRPREATAQSKKRREANMEAANLARKLSSGEVFVDVPWNTFCQRYESEKLILDRRQTRSAWIVASNSLNRFKTPAFLSAIDGRFISKWT